ncbi:MAG: nucleoside triphosphate pyrophosphohydrolase [Bacteroidetes bacterium]|nr:nucleoside triphosphate pyrophosphohydrolase [Bacteroidota bacterium]MCL5739252.1 nucleoside triphosphate pyrophosphohydrolase [Bacteroidota bacterium]
MTKIEENALQEFVEVVRRLRQECPWDKIQTNRSIRHYTIEEVYELAEAIDQEKWDEVKGELGDILLNVFLHSQIAEDEGKFTLVDVVRSETKKMIVRHPHVFGNVEADTPEQVKVNWERIKTEEGRESIFDGIPAAFPALARAFKIQDRAAKVGFDWGNAEEVWPKVEEEMKELRQAVKSEDAKRVEEEFGDLLFSLVNYARHIGVHPESALRTAVEKFQKRFLYIEDELDKRNVSLHDASLDEMNDLWEKSKKGV